MAEDESSAPKKRGRPATGRRGTFAFRVTDDLRAKLEEASRQSKKPVSEEIEFRLEQSFRENELNKILLSDRGARLINYLFTALKAARSKSGKNWESEPEIANAVGLAFHSMLLSCSPVGSDAGVVFRTDEQSWRRSKMASNYIATYTLMHFGDASAVNSFVDESGAITPGEAIERYIINREQF